MSQGRNHRMIMVDMDKITMNTWAKQRPQVDSLQWIIIMVECIKISTHRITRSLNSIAMRLQLITIDHLHLTSKIQRLPLNINNLEEATNLTIMACNKMNNATIQSAMIYQAKAQRCQVASPAILSAAKTNLMVASWTRLPMMTLEDPPLTLARRSRKLVMVSDSSRTKWTIKDPPIETRDLL